jgi:hypothetical protein
VGGPFGHANATRSKKKPTLTGTRLSQAARDASRRPVVLTESSRILSSVERMTFSSKLSAPLRSPGRRTKIISRSVEALPSPVNLELRGFSYPLSASVHQLLRNHLDLLVDHLAGKPIDRHVYPVMLFAFHNEIVLKTGCIWFEPA